MHMSICSAEHGCRVDSELISRSRKVFLKEVRTKCIDGRGTTLGTIVNRIICGTFFLLAGSVWISELDKGQKSLRVPLMRRWSPMVGDAVIVNWLLQGHRAIQERLDVQVQNVRIKKRSQRHQLIRTTMHRKQGIALLKQTQTQTKTTKMKRRRRSSLIIDYAVKSRGVHVT